jgi:hypothetical protein
MKAAPASEANYDAYVPMNIERYCDFYSLGI